MRKLIISGMAVAMLAAIPAAASADVPRYQTQDATFTVTQPRGEGGTWIQDFTVKTNPCDDTFTGTAHQYSSEFGKNGSDAFEETVTGSFGSDDTVTMIVGRSIRNVVDQWTLVNAKMDGSSPNIATSYPTVSWQLDMTVTPKTITKTSDYKNHGQYVTAMGGGSDAAHSCIGMPLNSNK